MTVKFLFTNDELKLAIIYCLENLKKNKISINDIWLELKKIIRRPSFTKFIYLINKLKNQNLYDFECKLDKIRKDKKFYNKMINLLLKNKEKITYKFPYTNELLIDIINKYDININNMMKLLETNNIKVSIKKIKNNKKKNIIKTFYLKHKIYELVDENKYLTNKIQEMSIYKQKYYLLTFIFSIFFTFTFLPIFYFFISIN